MKKRNYLITQTKIYDYQSPSLKHKKENNNNSFEKIKQKIKNLRINHRNPRYDCNFGNYFTYYYGPLSKFIQNIYFTGNKKLEAIYDADEVIKNVCEKLKEEHIYGNNLIFINSIWNFGIIDENTIKLEISESMNIKESIDNFF
jgi:hypothetical protein